MMEAQGGTELTKKWLYENVDNDLLSRFNIVSRPDDMSDDAQNILWVHDLPADMPFIADPSQRNRFAGIVFVSSWQQTIFSMNTNVSYSESTVLRNAIKPIPSHEKTSDGIINLIYHPTPHRGLEILVPVFSELCKKYGNLHLDVYSNFDIYARPDSNERFEPLYQACRDHPNISYHGSQPNDVVRKALESAHIFAYPCIWRETSCISAMEAMSARCLIVAPDYAALPETLANHGLSYSWTENPNDHAARFAARLEGAINSINDPEVQANLDEQKAYADKFYTWDKRAPQWVEYLNDIANRPPKRRGGLVWN